MLSKDHSVILTEHLRCVKTIPTKFCPPVFRSEAEPFPPGKNLQQKNDFFSFLLKSRPFCCAVVAPYVVEIKMNKPHFPVVQRLPIFAGRGGLFGSCAPYPILSGK